MKRGQSASTIILLLFIVGWVIFRSTVPRVLDRSLGQVVIEFMPVFIAGALALFIHFSNPRQRLGVALTFIAPGVGHWFLGHRSRALFFAGLIVPTFLLGMALAGFTNVSPFDRHPIWGIAQLPGGLLSVAAWLATSPLKISADNPYYQVGCLFTGSACLLNILVMCDIWDLEEVKPAPGEAAAPAAGRSGPASPAAPVPAGRAP